jgi:hypothetical protein
MLSGIRNTILCGFLTINLAGCVGYYDSKSSARVEKDMTLALLVVPESERKLWKKERPQIIAESKFVNDERAGLGIIPIGQKDQKKDQVIQETKIYNDKTRWCGRTVWAIFPIPLLTRSCRTYTELTLENGDPVSAHEQYLETSQHICGPFLPLLKVSQGFCIDSDGIE